MDAGGPQPPGGGLPPTPWTADAGGDDDPPFHHLLWAGAGIGIGAVCAQAWTAYRRWWLQSGGISADALDTCVREWEWIECPVGWPVLVLRVHDCTGGHTLQCVSMEALHPVN